MAGHGQEQADACGLSRQTCAVAGASCWLYPLAAVAATLVIRSLLVLAAGASPFSVFYLVARGAAGSQFALLETLTRATPLIFTGLAVAVAFRAKLWNIGAEAQLYIGAVVTVLLGTGALPLPAILLSRSSCLRRWRQARCCCSARPC